MRICRLATIPFALRHHIGGQIDATVKAGHEVHVISSPVSDFASGNNDSIEFANVTYHPIVIARELSLWSDICAVVAMFRCFRRERFDVVHSMTSKAGFLAAIAAWVARVPQRMHTFAGQPWAGRTGAMRWVAKSSDWLIARLNTACYADSESQKRFLITEHVVQDRHVKVLGAGSIAGVDLRRFNCDRYDRSALRRKHMLAPDVMAVIFIGRISTEKGIIELVDAFVQEERVQSGSMHLFLVGPIEVGLNAPPPATQRIISEHPSIASVGYTSKPEDYLALGDVLCLPSYREGFGTVIVEAAAMGLPAIATRVTGLVDSVVDGETGILVPAQDVVALAAAFASFRNDPDQRRRLGEAAKARVERDFDAERVNRLVLQEYNSIPKHSS